MGQPITRGPEGALPSLNVPLSDVPAGGVSSSHNRGRQPLLTRRAPYRRGLRCALRTPSAGTGLVEFPGVEVDRQAGPEAVHGDLVSERDVLHRDGAEPVDAVCNAAEWGCTIIPSRALGGRSERNDVSGAFASPLEPAIVSRPCALGTIWLESVGHDTRPGRSPRRQLAATRLGPVAYAGRGSRFSLAARLSPPPTGFALSGYRCAWRRPIALAR